MHDVNERLHQAAFPLRDVLHDDAALERVLLAFLGPLARGRGSGGQRGALPAGPGGPCTAPTPYPPSSAAHRRELDELTEKEGCEGLTAGQLRRIAELTELLEGETASLPRWQAAADAGDPLASEVYQDLIHAD